MKGVKDTHVHKNHKKVMTVLLAAGLTLVLACAAGLALYPTGSGARYVESEVYEGTEIYTETSHGDNHSGWVDLNSTQTTSAAGVSWSGTTCTISAGGKYYLSSDLTANIVVLPPENPDYDPTDSTSKKYESMGDEVVFCLDGFCLTCAAENTSAILIGNAGSSSADASDVVFSLYDCGGGRGVYYYKYYNANGDITGQSDGNVITSESVVYNGTTFVDWDGDPDEEVFHTGYEFDSSLNADTCDGYVRGGLITGAVFPKGSSGSNHRYYGGGVTVGSGCTFKMYGGTIAGNHVASGTYNDYIAAGVLVLNSTFDMYGGMIAGNCCGYFSTSYPSGSGVGLCGGNDDVTMNMYGGEIKENYKHSGGAGICCYLMTYHVATLTMYGGTVSENVSDGAGGGIMLSNNSGTVAFRMYGGTVRDNVAGGRTSRLGGGVDIAGPFEMTGGAIYGNRELNESGPGRGGGVYYSGGASDALTLGGEAYIYGNYAAGKISNLDIHSNSSTAKYITLSSPLTGGARVGVTLYSGYTQITTGGTDYLSASVMHMFSDDRSYGVQVASGGSYLELYTLTG